MSDTGRLRGLVGTTPLAYRSGWASEASRNQAFDSFVVS